MVSFAQDHRDWYVDPKLAWALEHREQFPVDVNRAPREALLRIPGVGPRTANRILQARKHRPLAMGDVRKLPVNWHQIRYFVATCDHRPRQFVEGRGPNEPAGPARQAQLELFDAAASEP